MSRHTQHAVHPEPELQRGRMECVFLTCFRSEFSVLATTLHYSGVRVLRAGSLDEADFLLTVTGATALLSDVTFLDGDWRDAMRMLAQLHPLVPFLIVADPVDSPYLEDAYARGACGVLWKPFDFTLVIQMIRTVGQAARERAIWVEEAYVAEPSLR